MSLLIGIAGGSGSGKTLIILEEILILYYPELRELMDIKVFREIFRNGAEQWSQ